MFTRAAYHAEDIKDLIGQLTKFDKVNKSATPEDFIEFFKSMG